MIIDTSVKKNCSTKGIICGYEVLGQNTAALNVVFVARKTKNCTGALRVQVHVQVD
jgi:hypothetical protein